MDIETMPEQYIDVPTSDRECVICQRPRISPSEDEGQILRVQGKFLYICPEHCDAFTIGMGIGKTELNGKVVQALCGLDDGATGWDVKQAVYDIIPLAKRQIQEHKRLKTIPIYNPREIYENLETHVVGQKEAKTRIALSVFEHVKQIRDNDTNIAPDKHNILLLGPSGCGKTLLAHTVAQYLELPFTSADSTSFSPTGYQGADADTTVADLFSKSKNVIQTAEKGFIFFDEIDKLGTYNYGDNSRGEILNVSTQNSLLRLIEGKKVKVPLNNMGDSVQISTDKILFFFGGAFPGLVDIVAKLKGFSGKQIGLRTEKKGVQIEAAKKTYDILCNASLDIMTQALVEYGLSAELVGRIPVVVPLAPLNKEQLTEYMIQIEHSPILRQKCLFAESGYELDFTDEFVDAIVEKSYLMATGTRALVNAVKTSVSQAAFDLLTGPTRSKNGRITITEACLTNPSAYILTPKIQKSKVIKTQVAI